MWRDEERVLRLGDYIVVILFYLFYKILLIDCFFVKVDFLFVLIKRFYLRFIWLFLSYWKFDEVKSRIIK